MALDGLLCADVPLRNYSLTLTFAMSIEWTGYVALRSYQFGKVLILNLTTDYENLFIVLLNCGIAAVAAYHQHFSPLFTIIVIIKSYTRYRK